MPEKPGIFFRRQEFKSHNAFVGSYWCIFFRGRQERKSKCVMKVQLRSLLGGNTYNWVICTKGPDTTWSHLTELGNQWLVVRRKVGPRQRFTERTFRSFPNFRSLMLRNYTIDLLNGKLFWQQVFAKKVSFFPRFLRLPKMKIKTQICWFVVSLPVSQMRQTSWYFNFKCECGTDIQTTEDCFLIVGTHVAMSWFQPKTPLMKKKKLQGTPWTW